MNARSFNQLLISLLAVGLCGPFVRAEGPEETYLLRYKFSAGDEVQWKVEHLATTETKIQGNTQTSKSRSLSTKVWRVSKVDPSGPITFTHHVDHVDMWQQLSDRPEVRYNSDTDTEIPTEYQHVAQTIGVPLTEVTISAKGDIIERKSSRPNPSFGVGEIVMLLPEKPVKAGSRWYEPAELQTRLPDGRVKDVKIRKLYTLEKVQTGVATITVKTEVLTPLNDARIEAQLVQQLTNGTVKFDIDAGRILFKQLDWDETVVGFSGADSLMKYLARFTEEIVLPEPVARTARAVSEPVASPE